MILTGRVDLRNFIETDRPTFLAGSLLYMAGGILVTMMFNVPLNQALAGADPERAEAAHAQVALWPCAGRRLWTHVRPWPA
jgi:uncharacterized membrane protein